MLPCSQFSHFDGFWFRENKTQILVFKTKQASNQKHKVFKNNNNQAIVLFAEIALFSPVSLKKCAFLQKINNYLIKINLNQWNTDV